MYVCMYIVPVCEFLSRVRCSMSALHRDNVGQPTTMSSAAAKKSTQQSYNEQSYTLLFFSYVCVYVCMYACTVCMYARVSFNALEQKITSMYVCMYVCINE